MYIILTNFRHIVDSRYIARYLIDKKTDAVLITATSSNPADSRPIILGRYKDEKEAESVMGDLLTALLNRQEEFHMPDSLLYFEQKVKKDARTQRRGGS